MNLIKIVALHKRDEDQRLVIGIVYEPDKIDLDGDFASAETIRSAAHGFLADYRVVKLMHKQETPGVVVVESFIAPLDFHYGDLFVPNQAWVVVLKIHDDTIWEKIKDGTLTGLSMGGLAERVPAHEVEK